MKQKIALIGAAGKMGSRITDNLVKESCYELLVCEKGEVGIRKLKEKGLKPLSTENAAKIADIIIMAVPDTVLGEVVEGILPLLKKNATIVVLDPAAPYAGEIPIRKDITYVATHPCHPSLFREQKTSEAKRDFFGGVAAVQDIVIALIHGSEENFEKAKKLCCAMFSPVEKCYRVTLKQMALLEPALSEVIGATSTIILKEAVEVAASYGIPKEVAKSFILGHISTELAIAFGIIDADFSDACKVAIELGKKWVFQPEWQKVFKEEMIKKAIDLMLHPEKQIRKE